MAKIWRDDIDYSSELQRTDLTQAQRSQLETERAAKIADKYGGVEPNMSGSNVKFSDVYTGSGGKVLDSSGSPVSSGGSKTSDYKGITYTQEDGKGIYGLPTINSQQKNYTQNGVTYQVGANMARRPDLAGKIAISNGYTVFYDELGYATKAIKGVADYTPHQDYYVENGSYSGGNLWTDEEMLMPEDLARIEAIRAGIGTKYTGDEANQLANQIRSGYGYTIDKEGNVTDLLGKSRAEAFRERLGLSNDPTSQEQAYFTSLFEQAQNEDKDADLSIDILNQILSSGGVSGGDFGDISAPEYEGSKWDAVLDALAQQLVDMNYEDWTQGDQYAALARRYGQQGKMSMQDVLGQIASRTGGLASSYATSVAQQQYNDYMADLEAAAMEMYGVEREEMLDNAQLARQYSEDDYNRYLDRWKQWADNRDFQYNAYRDSVEDQRYEDEWEYAMSQQEKSDLADIADTLAAHGDFSGYKALGYTDEQIAGMTADYQAQIAAKNAKKTTGGSTGGGTATTPDYDGLFAAARDSGYPKSFIANNYKKYGFTSSAGLYDEYGDWDDGGTEEAAPAKPTTSKGGDYWLGDGSTAGGKTSLNWDQDEGIFTWNGRNYSDADVLMRDIDAAGLTDTELDTLKRKFALFGFNLS